jgi:hypothetical protein
MTEPPKDSDKTDEHKPMSESELEAYLAGDSQLSRRYRDAGLEIEPSDAVDQRILDSAKAALRAPPKTPEVGHRRRWDLALGAAAVIVLSVSIVSWLEPAFFASRNIAFSDRSDWYTEDAAPPTLEMTARERAALERPAASQMLSLRQFPERASVGTSLDTAADRASLTMQNAMNEAEPALAPLQQTTPLERREAPKARPSKDAEDALGAATEHVDQLRARQQAPAKKQPSVLAKLPAPAAPPTSQSPGEIVANSTAAGADSGRAKREEDAAIGAWLERFVPLLESSDRRQLEALLREFRERYPKYRLSQDLASKLDALGIDEARIGPRHGKR